MVQYPKAFLPALIGLAKESEDFSNNLVKYRILNVAYASPRSKRHIDIEPSTFNTMMNLLRGLVMTQSERRETLLQDILNFLLLQSDLLDYGATDKDDQI